MMEVIRQKLPVVPEADTLNLTFTKTRSETLRTHLDGCSHIILCR